VYGSSVQGKSKLMAIVSRTLQYREVLDLLLPCLGIEEQPDHPPVPLLLVVMCEFLFGPGEVEGGGGAKRLVLAAGPRLKVELAQLMERAGVTEASQLVRSSAVERPGRWARINTLLTSRPAVLTELTAAGYSAMQGTLQELLSLPAGSKTFWEDPDISEFLCFPPDSDLHELAPVTQGHLILQDKASYLPALALAPPPDSHVIDATAAPGMKTSSLAALLGRKGTGRVFAFDKNAARIESMKGLLEKFGATNVTCENRDFLLIDPAEPPASQATHILVDPTCSGSGIARPGVEEPVKAVLKTRLRQLAQFQLRVLSHALSFPVAQRVVYSTCSIHQTENENVVAKALELFPDFHLVRALPFWTHRGHAGVFPSSEFCVRAGPDDGTIGFFLACFERGPAPAPPAVPPAETKKRASEPPQHSSKRKKKSKQRPQPVKRFNT
jgi:putative methyltransferase